MGKAEGSFTARLTVINWGRLAPQLERGMIMRGIGFALAIFLMAFAGEARAWTAFGMAEQIVRMQDVALTTPAGDPLFLAHKTSTVYFIGGVFVKDDGYVLCLQSNPKHYVDMPPPDLLATFQKQGKLPDPLPPYHLGIGDYVNGYSLWIVLVPSVIAYFYLLYAIRGRRRRRPARR